MKAYGNRYHHILMDVQVFYGQTKTTQYSGTRVKIYIFKNKFYDKYNFKIYKFK